MQVKHVLALLTRAFDNGLLSKCFSNRGGHNVNSLVRRRLVKKKLLLDSLASPALSANALASRGWYTKIAWGKP